MDSVDFDKLVGVTGALHYCSLSNCFQLGNVIFEVLEDSDDGRRSYLKGVTILNQNALTDYPNNYFLANVVIGNPEDDIYNLWDQTDGHVWLRFGTDDTDDYYPYFVFDWKPIPTL